jgi:hypothetical protein
MNKVINELDIAVWKQLDLGIWPTELEQIKPERWDESDRFTKGKLVLENFDQFLRQLKHLKMDRNKISEEILSDNGL